MIRRVDRIQSSQAVSTVSLLDSSVCTYVCVASEPVLQACLVTLPAGVDDPMAIASIRLCTSLSCLYAPITRRQHDREHYSRLSSAPTPSWHEQRHNRCAYAINFICSELDHATLQLHISVQRVSHSVLRVQGACDPIAYQLRLAKLMRVLIDTSVTPSAI